MHASTGLPPEALARARAGAAAPLVAHVIFRLDTGGLENGLVNLINHMAEERFRHAVICLTGYTRFRERIGRADVPVFALNKAPGNSPLLHLRLWRLFMRLRPDIVHTRNLGTLEAQLPAALAGVPARIHGEHGWDVGDTDGSNRRNRALRRLFRPLVHRYIALSKHLERYLCEGVGVPPQRVLHLCNGVDTKRFHPAGEKRAPLPAAEIARPGAAGSVPRGAGECAVPGAGEFALTGAGELAPPGAAEFAPPGAVVIGTVGRMQPVKDPLNLARAFVLLRRMAPPSAPPLRLVMAGAGPLRAQVAALLAEGGAAGEAWLAGERDDVPALLRGMDLFVLPSVAEGISNTILEAMASGLPVVATDVGGNAELVEDGRTGCLVPSSNPEAMARAMLAYCLDVPRRRRHGAAARAAAERRFSIDSMVEGYGAVYERLLSERGVRESRSCAE